VKRSSFGAWAIRRRVAFGLLTRETEDRSRDRECRRITARNLVLNNSAAKDSFAQGPKIDAMLSSAFIAGYDYILIQAQGNYLLDKPEAAEAFDEEMERGFFVICHLLDKGPSYFSIHHQCLCVDLNEWDKLGRPDFGAPDDEPTLLHRPLRSVENFHGKHTPVWIAPSGENRRYSRRSAGWNFINVALNAGARVAPFSQRLRHCKAYLYPENDDDYYFLMGDQHRAALAWCQGAWVANTEELPPMRSTEFAGPVETIFSVASGLNTYVFLERLGFDRHTAIHYIDASAATLAFKRWLLENWNGVDYVSAVTRWLGEQREITMQRSLSDRDVTAATDGFEKPLADRWKEFRHLSHHFHNVDLLTSDCNKVISLIDSNSTKTLIWWSNVFYSYYTHALLSEEANAALFRYRVEKIRARNPQVFVVGKSHVNESLCMRVREINVARLPRELPKNIYYPPELLTWFKNEQVQFREINRR